MTFVSHIADIFAMFFIMRLLYAEPRKPNLIDLLTVPAAVALTWLNLYLDKAVQPVHLLISACAVPLLTWSGGRTILRSVLVYLTLAAVQAYLIALLTLWQLHASSWVANLIGCAVTIAMVWLMSGAMNVRLGSERTVGLIAVAAVVMIQGLVIAVINANATDGTTFGRVERIIFTLSFPSVMGLMLLLLRQFSRKRLEQQRRQFFEKLVDSERAHFSEQEQTMLSLRKFRHDSSNYNKVISQLIREQKYAELEQFVSTLDSRLGELPYSVYSGNTIADAVINEKQRLTESRGIAFEFDGIIPARSALSDVEIASLLSNLLDNAIEAAGGIPGGYVSAVCRCDKRHLMVTVRNSCAEDVDPRQLRTSKHNISEHGYGLEIISSVAEAHDGDLRLSAMGGEFTAEVLVNL